MPSSFPPLARSRHDPPAGNDPDRDAPDGPGVLRVLRHSLDHALTALGETRDEHSVTAERVKPPDDDAPPVPHRATERTPGRPSRPRRWIRIYEVEGPASVSARICLSAAHPPRSGPIRVCVGFEDGPSVRYTVRRSAVPENPETARGSGPPARSDPVAALGRKVTAFLFRELEHRLDALRPTGGRDDASGPSPTLARLALTREAEIRELTPRARALLGYSEQQDIDPNFFTHVDGHNLRRVMCDLAEMVEGQKERARWLLRLRGGERRWRWFRAAVQNRLNARGTIEVILRPLSTQRCRATP